MKLVKAMFGVIGFIAAFVTGLVWGARGTFGCIEEMSPVSMSAIRSIAALITVNPEAPENKKRMANVVRTFGQK